MFRQALRLGTFALVVGMMVYPWLRLGVSKAARVYGERALAARAPLFADHRRDGHVMMAADDYRGAVAAFALAIEAAGDGSGIAPHYLTDTFASKGEAHLQRDEFAAAEVAFQDALRFAGPNEAKALRRRLSHTQRYIVRTQFNVASDAYVAAPGVGPAKRLRGRVVTVYVFVDDGRVSRWSGRAREQALLSQTRAEAWYRDRAIGFGVPPPQFVRRVYVYDRDPQLRNAFDRLVNRDLAVGYDVAERVAELQGLATVNAFLERVAVEEDADHAMLILHVNVTTRSYALRCVFRCWSDAEYVFLFRSVTARDLAALPAVQAHESLHVFGAADLYNVDPTGAHTHGGIMYRAPRDLRDAAIDSVTAFAVGWLADMPQRPFPIVNAGPSNPGVPR